MKTVSCLGLQAYVYLSHLTFTQLLLFQASCPECAPQPWQAHYPKRLHAPHSDTNFFLAAAVNQEETANLSETWSTVTSRTSQYKVYWKYQSYPSWPGASTRREENDECTRPDAQRCNCNVELTWWVLTCWWSITGIRNRKKCSWVPRYREGKVAQIPKGSQTSIAVGPSTGKVGTVNCLLQGQTCQHINTMSGGAIHLQICTRLNVEYDAFCTSVDIKDNSTLKLGCLTILQHFMFHIPF